MRTTRRISYLVFILRCLLSIPAIVGGIGVLLFMFIIILPLGYLLRFVGTDDFSFSTFVNISSIAAAMLLADLWPPLKDRIRHQIAAD